MFFAVCLLLHGVMLIHPTSSPSFFLSQVFSVLRATSIILNDGYEKRTVENNIHDSSFQTFKYQIHSTTHCKSNSTNKRQLLFEILHECILMCCPLLAQVPTTAFTVSLLIKSCGRVSWKTDCTVSHTRWISHVQETQILPPCGLGQTR